VWSPNVDYNLQEYFPGSKYIDYAALDGYNKHRSKLLHPAMFHPDISFYDCFAPSIAVLQQLTEKPIMIAETNSARPGNFRVNWFADAIHQAASWEQVIALGGFFWNKAGILDPNETNWSPSNWQQFNDMLSNHPYVLH